MIKVTVELWPHGDQTRRQTLAEAEIGNTGGGDSGDGHYEYRIRGKSGQMMRNGFVSGFKRMDYSVWWLVAICLRYAFPDVEACFWKTYDEKHRHKAVDPVKTKPIEP